MKLLESAERALALKLLDFSSVLLNVALELEPHRLCSYLLELSQTFSIFYEQCRVMNAEPSLRHSRVVLCAQTRDALVTGLELLGIGVPDVM